MHACRKDTIIRTARAMAVTTPGIDDKFRAPKGGDQNLLHAARAFARDAAPFAQRFIEYYLPDDFLTDLEQDIKRFEAAMRDQEAGKDTKAAAAASIDAAMDAGIAAVLQLDAFVPNRLRNDPAKLAMWERARRVEYPSRSRQDQAAASASSAPAVAAAAGVS